MMPSARFTWKFPAFPKMETTGVSASSKRQDVPVFMNRVPGKARCAESSQLGVLQLQLLARAKNSLSFGFEPGHPPSM